MEGVGALRILSSNAVESILRRRIAATRQLTVIIKHEGDGFVAMCAELDIASQGTNVSEARENLRETLELFFEVAPNAEVQRRISSYAL